MKQSYKEEDYVMSQLELKILQAIAHSNNYFDTAYAKAANGKKDLTMKTLDARKATKAVSNLLKTLKL